ncbi:aldose 1-epimerase family protein [Rathayibacter toxicus]|uniref:Aldose 1-epimerase family protein n=1 Tax=Rathayibacter toxicus TaxID=145458 RepID=A0A0U1PSN1_9MICO|nr:aldose 1-epimerase family protein [Rathayibacter toxicus]ALS58083.1 hypothetical protein APU90_10160 [Rathayibacter toxicus]KKM45294.1 hypothetical protein VT73_06545 [Rathayibacter toxicus]PPG21885.1 aldose 1-epimerase family protein [Rathayibacter toxicus]PPG46847.1 aldose 1-epimerase family protein [Rathayibacter toxicus]PPH63730.1 aldose 1-epimerase family protein [Rathayibacter toxicus]
MSCNDSSDPIVLSLASDQLRLTLSTAGAELSSLRDNEGREYLWQAGEQWRRHAPVLFPIIGRLPGDTLHHNGVDYRLGQHGFARDRVFELTGATADEALFRLHSDDLSRSSFPFDWTLLIAYAVTDATLRITQTLDNHGTAPLGASVGNHPAFTLPLPGATSVHRIRFAGPEPEGFCRAPENLLLPERHLAPLDNGVLTVQDTLFEDGVLIFDEPRRRTLTLEADGARSIRVDTGDFDVAGIWKPVGAPFICLEPWRSIPTPDGWDGEILDKPRQMLLEPGERRVLSYSITVQ